MATVSTHDEEGHIFDYADDDVTGALECVVADEVDYGISVIHLTKHSDIPDKYSSHEISTDEFQHTVEKPTRYRKIHSTWGTSISATIAGRGELALITLTPLSAEQGEGDTTLTAENVGDVVSHLMSVMSAGDYGLSEVLSYKHTTILMYCNDLMAYKTLGKAFINEELNDCAGFRVTTIEPAEWSNPPRCRFEVSVSPSLGDRLRDNLVPIISPFSSAFVFMNLHEFPHITDDIQCVPSPDPMTPDFSAPALGLTFLCRGEAQKRALKMIEELKFQNWRPANIPEDIKLELYDISHYVHPSVDMPVFGVKTGCALSGVRATVFVGNANNFPAMQCFYNSLLNENGYYQCNETLGIKSNTYNLSQRAELSLVFYPGFKIHSCSNISLNLVADPQSSPLHVSTKITEELQEVFDPEGNRVLLVNPLQ